MTICKFVPQACKAILKEFQHEYLTCPTDPEDWKKIKERFRNRWNVPHAVGALDGKHIAIKKPKKSGVNISTTGATSPWYYWLRSMQLTSSCGSTWRPVGHHLMLRY